MKARLQSESETSISIDDVVSLEDDVSIDNLNLSPTHYIEKATNVAMTYLPSSVEATVAKASQKVSEKASETVIRTRERASSFLETIRRSNTLTSREDIPRPQFEQHFDTDHLSIDTRSTSTSSEDLRSEATAKNDSVSMEASLIEEDESVFLEAPSMGKMDEEKSSDDEKEEELCSLVTNMLFTVMWRGGTPSNEKGSVIATINLLALDNNNELYRSHVDLKRRIVELSIQAVLADLKDLNANSNEVMAIAEDVMRWAYDLIVLDPYGGNFTKKVSEPLLDGILALTEGLMVFSEGKEDLEWGEMAKMAFDILLTCAERAQNENLDICTMATAKLHALVQTRGSSSVEENAFLMLRLGKIMDKAILQEDEHFSFLVPIMKGLLDKSKTSLNLQVQVPVLNLRLSGPEFFEHFKDYCQTEEWKYFREKKVQPLSDAYFKGYLAKLPTGTKTYFAFLMC